MSPLTNVLIAKLWETFNKLNRNIADVHTGSWTVTKHESRRGKRQRDAHTERMMQNRCFKILEKKQENMFLLYVDTSRQIFLFCFFVFQINGRFSGDDPRASGLKTSWDSDSQPLSKTVESFFSVSLRCEEDDAALRPRRINKTPTGSVGRHFLLAAGVNSSIGTRLTHTVPRVTWCPLCTKLHNLRRSQRPPISSSRTLTLRLLLSFIFSYVN